MRKPRATPAPLALQLLLACSAFTATATAITVSTCLPAVVALNGNTNITVTGDRAGSAVSVSLVRARFLGERSIASSSGRVALFSPTLVSLGPDSLSFVSPDIPAANDNYYWNVELENSAGEVGEGAEALFVTSQCPISGLIGNVLDPEDKTCSECPKHSICPGGPRLWPDDGYWNDGEQSTYVAGCRPSEACIGGRFPSCADAYDGEFCGDCMDGFYRLAEKCVTCSDNAGLERSALVGADLFFLFLLAVAAFVLPDSLLSTMVHVMLRLQIIQSVGQRVRDDVPSLLAELMQYTSFIIFDFRFLRPGCSGLSSGYEVVFFGQLALTLGFTLLLWLALLIVGHFRGKNNEDKAMWYSDRRYRIVTMCAHSFFLITMIRIFEALFCQEVGSSTDAVEVDPGSESSFRSLEHRLVVQMTVVCYTGWHTYAVSVAYILLLAYGIMLPICELLRLLFTNEVKREDEDFQSRWGYLYHTLKPTRHLFLVLTYYPMWLVLAASTVFLLFAPVMQFSVQIVTLVAFVGLALWRKPFKHVWKLVFTVGTTLFALGLVVVKLVSFLAAE